MIFDTLTVVAISLTISFLLSEFLFRIKYPRVIGQILAGLIIGIPLFKVFISPESLIDIQFLADLGIIFLLLITGMSVDIEKFKRSQMDTIVVAIFSVLVPFLFGFVLVKAAGYPTVVGLIVGACISLTAEGAKLKVLIDLKALNTKVGVIMLGAGILDDLFEVIFLSVVLVVAQKSYYSLGILPLKIILFVIITFVSYKVFPMLLRLVQKERSRVATFSFVVLFGIIIAVASTKLELGPIIGAFVAGVIIHLSDHQKKGHKENLKELEGMTYALIIPFFFINIGLHFDFTSLTNNWYLTIMIVVVAIAGKLLGAFVAKPFTSLSFKQLHMIGWGMNSRGSIELVIAQVALLNNLIPSEVYSSLVVMAIITTLVFPFALKNLVIKDRAALTA